MTMLDAHIRADEDQQSFYPRYNRRKAKGDVGHSQITVGASVSFLPSKLIIIIIYYKDYQSSFLILLLPLLPPSDIVSQPLSSTHFPPTHHRYGHHECSCSGGSGQTNCFNQTTNPHAYRRRDPNQSHRCRLYAFLNIQDYRMALSSTLPNN